MSEEMRTFDEMTGDESLCEYCKAEPQISVGSFCEGAWCEEAYERYLSDNGFTEEMVKANEETEVKVMNDNNNKSVEVKFPVDDIFAGVKAAVKAELETELRKDIKQEITDGIKRQILEEIKEEITRDTNIIVKQIIEDIYDTEKIVVGGGWNNPAKEYTLRDYIIQQVKERVTDGEVVVDEDKDNTSWYNTEQFRKWFTDQCVTPEINRQIKKNIADIQNDVNKRIKEVFEDGTKNMLSESVASVLMANETYQKILGNVSQIAGK